MRRIFAGLLSMIGGLLLVGAFVTPVSGGQLPASMPKLAVEQAQISIGTVYVEAAPGSSVELGRVAVDPELVGTTCSWSVSAVASNQHSVHPGNNIVVRSGDAALTLAGVEDVANGQTSTSGTVSLGSEVVATLVMGPDGRFSGGVTVTMTLSGCAVPTTVTTEAPAEVEPSTPDTETSTTTTTPTPTPTTTAAVEPAGPTTAPPPPTTASVAATTAPLVTELPVTGAQSSAALAAAGLAMILAGLALVRSAEGATAA